MTSYDIIGDIHGHAEPLRRLLKDLGYARINGTWKHSERTAVFVGDLIDRGPEQLETIDMVRRMTDEGAAQAIMGNHEFNAIAWKMGLRKHSKANLEQHQAFLDAVDGNEDLHEDLIQWFLTMPLWLDLPEIRVIHACWHPTHRLHVEKSLGGDRLHADAMPEATRKSSPNSSAGPEPSPSLHAALEVLLKGVEVKLPDGLTFRDVHDRERTEIRTRWWDDAATSFTTAAIHENAGADLPDLPIPSSARIPYTDTKPLFIGHYWMMGTPEPLRDNTACVDYSIAKNGKLAAYRFDGESSLLRSKFWTASGQPTLSL
jgi:hypothetical protein